METDQLNIEYLKVIQPIIGRMNASSNSIKGIAIASTTFILGLAIKERMIIYNIMLFASIILFSLLDMYYLWNEKLYRELYEDIRINKLTDFSLNTEIYKDKIFYWHCLSSVSIYPIYLGILLINIFAMVIEYFL